jgi:hypothetical protein
MTMRFPIAVLLALAVSGFANAAEKKIVGWVEPVAIAPEGVEVNAKVDTGAETSSLDCACVTLLEEGDKVRFSVFGNDGTRVWFVRPVERIARIKRHNAKTQERPVVTLGLCMGDTYREVEVNLVNREGFKYPMLLGRNFTRDAAIVDPGATLTTTPSCKEIKPDG